MHQAATFGLAAVEAAHAIRVLTVVEATRMTGVAKNLFDLARLSQSGVAAGPAPVVPVMLMLALIRRERTSSAAVADVVLQEAAAVHVPAEVLIEHHRYDRTVVAALRRIVQRLQPDLVETHHVKSHCLMALSGLWRHRPWVAFHHGYTQTDLRVRIYNHVDRWSLRHAAHVVTTNHRFAAELSRRGVDRGRITVLHNGVSDRPASAGAGHALRRSLGVRDDERIVLAVGRLSREKGQCHLIKAAASWRGQARLVIVGDGPDRPRLERYARECGLGGSVVFAGYRADVSPFYHVADVFALPSLSEGSPSALLEAMSYGLPVVATAVGGVPEIAEDEVSALLGSPQDPAFLAGAISRLLGDAALRERIGAAARRVVGCRYTRERRAAELTRVYTSLVQHRQSSVGAHGRL